MANKLPIHSAQAPAAIGPYSQAIRSGDLVFLSGQIPLDPQSMTLVEGSINEQTHRVLQNLQAVCQAAGAELDQLLRITIYLTDLSDFAAVNDIMSQYFNQPYPARATVQVAALPKGATIEIDGILGL